MVYTYPSVMRAKLTGDHELLRELGRRGGLTTAQRRKEQQTRWLARLLQGVREMEQQANEDVCPID